MNKYIRWETYRDECTGQVIRVWGIYYGCIIEYRCPQDFYFALLPEGGHVRADTLAGIKEMIRDAIGKGR